MGGDLVALAVVVVVVAVIGLGAGIIVGRRLEARMARSEEDEGD